MSSLTSRAIDRLEEQIESAWSLCYIPNGRYGVLWTERDCRAADRNYDDLVQPLAQRLARLRRRRAARVRYALRFAADSGHSGPHTDHECAELVDARCGTDWSWCDTCGGQLEARRSDSRELLAWAWPCGEHYTFFPSGDGKDVAGRSGRSCVVIREAYCAQF